MADTTTTRTGSAGEQITDQAASAFATKVEEVRSNVARVIKGKPEAVELAMVCMFAEGHLLVEDVPGVGKTQLARALSASVDAEWHRVQFTPDLLPSDVTGVTIYHQASGKFEFHPGPVFANIVLADEINRASPRTQAALLEVMEERQVTVDGVAHPVPRPFMVIATQNPVDMDGTYPLPEAQLDRFLIRTSMGYPDHAAELEIVRGQNGDAPTDRLSPVLSIQEAGLMARAIHQVFVAPEVSEYLVKVVAATRGLDDVRLPVSPRGTVGLLRAVRARALINGRPFVTPDDIKRLAPSVLSHRIMLTPDAALSGVTAEDIVARVLDTVAVPQREVRR